MNYIRQWLEDNLHISHSLENKILSTLFIIILLFLIQALTLKIAHKKVESHKARYIWQKAFGYITTFIAIILLGNVWINDIKSFQTVVGFFLAGVAIALKDLVTDIAGWVFIIWRRPFYVGDRIEIMGHKGDVTDTRLFQFSLLEIESWVGAEQYTGRIIHIPNGKVFIEPVLNYNRGFNFIWDEIPVLITNESNWKKAKDILQKINEKYTGGTSSEAKKNLLETSKKFLINITSTEPNVYTRIESFGTLLTLRYLCLPNERRNTHELISEAILEEFAKHEDIDFAYPTHRIYSELLEGKSVKKSEGGSINLSFANPFGRK